MTSVVWKSSEILKVFGTTIREGIYTGGKATSGGVITQDSPTAFTPAKIAKIYENISTHIPIYLGHSTDPSRREIGYAYKFGVTETLDDIKYNGFVFDKTAINKIVTEGYDKVSPEISPDDERLLAICFVPNPAISGTEAGMEAIVFSQGDTNTNNMTDNVVTPQPSAAPVAQPVVATPTPAPYQAAEPKPIVPDVSALVAQVEDQKAKADAAMQKLEAIQTQQYDTLVAEMKSLGVNDPSAIVRGLDTEKKIAVLSKMKENIVITKPLSETTNSPPPANDGTTVNKAVDEVLAELGVSKEEYDKIRKR